MYQLQCVSYNVSVTMYQLQCISYNVSVTMYQLQCISYNVFSHHILLFIFNFNFQTIFYID